MSDTRKTITAKSDGHLVRLGANLDEGWPAEDAFIVSAENANGVIVVRVIDTDEDDDDGLREITADQLDFDYVPRCPVCLRRMVAAREQHADGTWTPYCMICRGQR